MRWKRRSQTDGDEWFLGKGGGRQDGRLRPMRWNRRSQADGDEWFWWGGPLESGAAKGLQKGIREIKILF